MSYDFISIDFETANKKYDSACSVGIVAVKNGEIVDKYYSLINPESEFDPSNVKIHGITVESVSDAPTKSEVKSVVEKYLSSHWPIVAHNAYFDVSVLRKSLRIDEEGLWYVDTMSLSSPFVDDSLSLVNCATAFGISVDNHHNALDDAIVCAEIVNSVVSEYGCISIIELLAKNGDIKRHILKETAQTDQMIIRKSRQFKSSPKPSEICRTVETINTSNPLCGKNIVFTGELSISRAEAMQLAVNAGAVIKSSVSRKTDYLVVGQQDIEIVGSDGMSTKEEKAHALNEDGKANIVLLDEKKFIELATGEPAAGLTLNIMF